MSLQNLELLIIDRLLEAQVCMKMMKVYGTRPGQPTTFWPETHRTTAEVWASLVDDAKSGIPRDDPTLSKLSAPPAAAITRMEETWQWMSEIKTIEVRQALAIKVFGWVYRVSSTKLAKQIGIDRRTLNRRFNIGIEKLMANICKERHLPEPVDENLVSRFRPKQAMNNRNIAASAA